MARPKPKFRLKATQVDRIAFVDRPAVPDAEIVMFKRAADTYLDKIEALLNKAMDFESEFLLQATDAAVSSLEQAFWSVIFDSELDASAKTSRLNSLFKVFEETLFKVMAMAGTEKQEGGPSPSEVEQGFVNSLATIAVTDAFHVFRQHVGFFVMNASMVDESDAIIKRLIVAFKKFIMDQTELIITKKLTIEKSEVLNKEGRIISTARLGKLKKAIEIMAAIIEEAEGGRITKREDDMTLEELVKAQELQAASIAEMVKSIAEVLEVVKGMKEAAVAGTEKFSGLETRFKELEEKVSKGSNVTQVDREQREKDRLAIEQIIIDGKKDKETAEKRLDKVEEVCKQVVEGFNKLAKRQGSQTGLGIEIGKGADDKPTGDAFGDAMKKKTALEKQAAEKKQ